MKHGVIQNWDLLVIAYLLSIKPAPQTTRLLLLLNRLLLLWNGPEQLAARDEMLRQKTSRVKTSIVVVRKTEKPIKIYSAKF